MGAPPDRKTRKDCGKTGDQTTDNTSTASRPGRDRCPARPERQPAKRGKTHDADIEQPGITPLDVQPQRHDRRDQAHIEQREGDVPALDKTNKPEQQRHHAKQQDVTP